MPAVDVAIEDVSRLGRFGPILVGRQKVSYAVVGRTRRIVALGEFPEAEVHHLLVKGSGRRRAADRKRHADLHVELERFLLRPLTQGRIDPRAAPAGRKRPHRHPRDVGEIALEQLTQVDDRVALRRFGDDLDGGADALGIGATDHVADRILFVRDVVRFRLHKHELLVEQLPLHDILVQREVGEEPAARNACGDHELLAHEAGGDLTKQLLRILILGAGRIRPQREHALLRHHVLGDFVKRRKRWFLFRRSRRLRFGRRRHLDYIRRLRIHRSAAVGSRPGQRYSNQTRRNATKHGMPPIQCRRAVRDTSMPRTHRRIHSSFL